MNLEIIPYNGEYELQLKNLLYKFEIEVELKRTSFDLDDDLAEMLEENVEDALKQIESGNNHCYLALSFGNKVVGFQLTHLYHNKADDKILPGDLEVSMLYVHPEHRKKGIARMLDEHCLERVKEIDAINRIITFVEEGNPNMLLKKELGFKRSFGYRDGARIYNFFNKSI